MSAFDHTKPFKTRDGQSVDLKISDGRSFQSPEWQLCEMEGKV